MAEPVAQMPHMPEYGVRPGTWEPLPWSWAAERLLACRNFWVVTDDARRRVWARRYLEKYRPASDELTEEFVLGGAVVEVVPDKAIAIIERAEEFATRPTRWVFDA